MVVLATPERAATASTVSEPTSPSRASSCKVASRIACRERSTRGSGLAAVSVMRFKIQRNVVLYTTQVHLPLSYLKRYGALYRRWQQRRSRLGLKAGGAPRSGTSYLSRMDAP